MDTLPKTPDPSPVILFGLDDHGKGHASRFEPADAPLAEKAAALMGMKILRVTTPEAVALAAELPAGRVFASGRGFVPFVARSRFDRLAASPDAFTPPPPVDMPARAPAKAKGGHRASAGGIAAPGPSAGPERPGTPAGDWGSITTGSLVLAAEEGIPEVWHVATVVADRGEDLFELQWWDDGEGTHPLFVRRREHLGLFPPAVLGALS